MCGKDARVRCVFGPDDFWVECARGARVAEAGREASVPKQGPPTPESRHRCMSGGDTHFPCGGLPTRPPGADGSPIEADQAVTWGTARRYPGALRRKPGQPG